MGNAKRKGVIPTSEEEIERKARELSDRVLEYANIEVVLKDGSVRRLDALRLTAGELYAQVVIYQRWQYAGIADPLGQAVGIIINALSAPLNAIQTAVNLVSTALQSAREAILSAIEGVASSISATINSAMQSVTNTISGVTSYLSQLSNQIVSSFQSVITTISNTIQSVSSTLNSAISSLSERFHGLITNVLESISNLGNTLRGLITNVTQAVTSGFQQLQGFFTNLIQNVANQLANIGNLIRSAFENVQRAISNVANNIMNVVRSSIEGVRQFMGQMISQFQSLISNIMTHVTESLANLQNAIGSLGQSIVQGIRGFFDVIANQIQNLSSALSNVANLITESIRNVVGSIGKTVSDAFRNVSNVIEGIRSALNNIGQNIFQQLQGLWNTLKELYTNVIQQLGRVASTISGAVKDSLTSFITEVSKALEEMSKGFAGWFVDITKTLKGMTSAFQGFVNPLVEIKNWLVTTLPQVFRQYLVDPLIAKLKELGSEFRKEPVLAAIELAGLTNPMLMAIATVWRALGYEVEITPDGKLTNVKRVTSVFDLLGKITSDAWDILQGRITAISEWMSNVLKGVAEFTVQRMSDVVSILSEAMKDTLGTLGEVVRSSFESFIGVVKPLFKGFFDSLLEISGLFRKPSDVKSPTDVVTMYTSSMFEMVVATFFVDTITLLGASSLVSNVLDMFREIEAKISPILASIGGKIRPALPWKSFSEFIKTSIEEFYKTFFFTFSFWWFEPTKYLLNPYARGFLPIEIPTLREIIEIGRRYYPTEKSDYALKQVQRILEMRGYPPWLDEAILSNPAALGTDVTDRFGAKRRLPSAIFYDLPTPSDFVRMMLRDIFATFDDFKRAIAMRGFYEDVAKLYYLLHFKYPSLDKLYEFVTRAAAGMAWYVPGDTIKKEIEKIYEIYGIRYRTLAPAELNADLPSDPQVAIQKITQTIYEYLDKISPYLKWHDYFPSAWIDGFTSDQMLVADMMADIPQRIDSRWMYKWGIISELDVVRIVAARGMHPKWIEPIALAEMMNALAEERTYVRTGVINAYKEGFLKSDALFKQFTNLTSVKLLGKDVPVRFLEGEAKLLELRARYDRAMDILNDSKTYLKRAYADNIIEWDDVLNVFRGIVARIQKALGLNLVVDEKYFETYKLAFDFYRLYEDVSRVRRWLRYAIYPVMRMLREGIVSSKEALQMVGGFAKLAKLSDLESKFFAYIFEAQVKLLERSLKADAVLKLVSRGILSPDEAVEALKQIGVEEDVAKALVEAKGKVYTLSIGTYLSYADLVEIPEDMLIEKMKRMGVPKDEANLILQVFRLKPIKSEVARFVSAELDLFENGFIDEDTLRSNLLQLGLRKDSATILIEVAKVRKEERKKRNLVEAILGRLRRGVIDLNTARRELKKLIVDEEFIDALIERNIRTYTFSVDKMISMSEYVPVDISDVMRKAELFGYPQEEIKLLPAYKIARDLSEEIKRLANELGNAFADGLIEEADFRRALDELATLNGQVKKYGVDWIVLSPEEREALVQLYKIRRARKLAKKSGG